MATLYTHQDSNIRKTWFLMTVFFVIIICLGWAFSYYFENPAILSFAIIFSILMNITSYWYSDKIALKMSGAIPADEIKFQDLHNIVENLSITAGLPKPRVYIISDPSPNAFATGRNAKNSAVAVTTGLLDILEKSELEGVIAHELSHIGNRDILVSTVVVVLVGFIALLSDMFLRMAIHGGGRSNDSGNKGKAIILVIGLILAILAPIASTLIQLAISRKREFLADASGALLTRYPEGLANALKKISANPNQLQKVSKATAHMFIANPFKGKNISNLFMTHPPVEERIKALLGKNNPNDPN
ncbi:MAG: Protease HtpX-like protein [Candidatus Campbellbacteria bacterium GW2011_GWD1_35_49]|nr:MAG: HtpX2, heat shock protein HtpX, heat shock protein HtpX [Candidatus Campbellbacteria bacterium GW2011_OD1_34_28]KKP74991.1 MAG: Protease HtpX-like protein [Candidatus Campbellbacteria bacterium GW2011_GWD2_35_24]KKP75877.1 MAG: heat shock protein HtpX, heat shock protein HtpX [Candidatus Campbellbacteria bacterium GW2011_GWC2_35_28]KKP76875.1 MAG: Protease HtpX-like protein [Candidatus Campbellbacteria bacterium GW2011_GWC1_35_31]KKP78801.1 MAG: Protease HtpX-like protein [Candidatus Ca